MSLFRYLFGINGPSGFGGSSTAEQVAAKYGENARDKVVVITGANSGVGFETARVLAKYARTVVLACRSEQSAKEAADKILAETPSADVRCLPLDLSSFASVRAFAEAFKQLDLPLHLLINNAGVMGTPRSFTADGWEMQFGTNHLGHFLLTNLLMDKLLTSAPSRVVNLSSEAHRFAPGKVDYDNLKSEKSYGAWAAYGRSKLCNIYFTTELQRRYGDRGLTAVALHPGAIPTNLQRHNSLVDYGQYLFRFLMKSIPQGAATSVWSALAPEVPQQAAGKYLADCNVSSMTALAADADEAVKLWEFSEKVIAA